MLQSQFTSPVANEMLQAPVSRTQSITMYICRFPSGLCFAQRARKSDLSRGLVIVGLYEATILLTFVLQVLKFSNTEQSLATHSTEPVVGE